VSDGQLSTQEQPNWIQPFAVHVSREADRTVMAVHGDVDSSTVTPMRDALRAIIADDGGDVVVDTAGVSFIGASGMGAFVDAQRTLAPQGRQFFLQSPSTQTLRIITLCGLGSMLDDPLLPRQATKLSDSKGGQAVAQRV
jgi:anti-anti-sigma factor